VEDWHIAGREPKDYCYLHREQVTVQPVGTPAGTRGATPAGTPGATGTPRPPGAATPTRTPTPTPTPRR
jgi:hypothetical protein